eukprot:9504076-Pyramimonas_sp.AAC.2
MGAPPKPPMGPPACVPRAEFGSVTDGPSATARMRSSPPSAALRGPIGSFTEEDIHNCGTHNFIRSEGWNANTSLPSSGLRSRSSRAAMTLCSLLLWTACAALLWVSSCASAFALVAALASACHWPVYPTGFGLWKSKMRASNSPASFTFSGGVPPPCGTLAGPPSRVSSSYSCRGVYFSCFVCGFHVEAPPARALSPNLVLRPPRLALNWKRPALDPPTKKVWVSCDAVFGAAWGLHRAVVTYSGTAVGPSWRRLAPSNSFHRGTCWAVLRFLVFFHNHPVVLRPRFEETVPRVPLLSSSLIPAIHPPRTAFRGPIGSPT